MRWKSVPVVTILALFMAAPLVAQEAAAVAADEAAEPAKDAIEKADMEETAEHAEKKAEKRAKRAKHMAAEHGAPDFEAMYASYMAAFNAGDLDGVLAHYADEATAMFQGGPATTGHAEMAPFFEEMFALGTQLTIHPGEQHVMGHMAVDQGHYVLTMEVEGETVTKSGYWMGILHEHDDGWKFVRLVSNSDQDVGE